MALKIKQFRYYGNGSESNYPADLNDKPEGLEESEEDSIINWAETKFVSGDAFNKYVPIVQLGIQALPGTQFGINNTLDLITIGNSGVFELDLNSQVSIEKLFFSRESLQAIEKSPTSCLIVDIIYGVED